MNQVSRQNTTTDVETDLSKLMDNSNFGFDCRNNTNNWFFQPIYDEIEELSDVKKYLNVFDQDIGDFISSEILERQLEEEYLNKFAKLDPQDEYFDAKKKFIRNSEKKDFDSIFSMKKSRQKTQKSSIKDIEQKIRDEENNPKTKSLIEFDASLLYSVKCLAVKKKKK